MTLFLTGRGKLARFALFAALLSATPALAQQNGGNFTGLKLSGDEPVQIESDALEVRESESTAIFTGNVAVVQGASILKAGKLTVYYAKSGGPAAKGSAAKGSPDIERLEAEGKVYFKSEEQVATGDKGTFNMKTEVLVLSGKEVVLSEGGSVATGCKFTVQMKTGQANLEGCGGRVSALLDKKSKPKK
jgi:lipopolysaccharide export system protein LptA